MSGARSLALLGNQNARKYPRLPDENDPTVQQQLAHVRDDIISDRGGREHLSRAELIAIDRMAVLALFLETWEAFFLKGGLYTRQGRTRSGYTSYLGTIDRFTRLAQTIGLNRRAHHMVGTPADLIARLAAEREAREAQDASNDHGDDDQQQQLDDRERPS